MKNMKGRYEKLNSDKQRNGVQANQTDGTRLKDMRGVELGRSNFEPITI